MSENDNVKLMPTGYHCPRLNEAGREGVRAYRTHVSAVGNPYDDETALFWAWTAGWCMGNAESKAYTEDQAEREQS